MKNKCELNVRIQSVHCKMTKKIAFVEVNLVKVHNFVKNALKITFFEDGL